MLPGNVLFFNKISSFVPLYTMLTGKQLQAFWRTIFETFITIY